MDNDYNIEMEFCGFLSGVGGFIIATLLSYVIGIEWLSYMLISIALFLWIFAIYDLVIIYYYNFLIRMGVI